MKALIFIVVAVVICTLLLALTAQGNEGFASYEPWSNGNVTEESVLLEAEIRALNPTIWMDGETFQGGTWLDKSGKGNDSVNTRNVEEGIQNSAAHGCKAAFKFIKGKKADKSNIRLSNGWPTNEKYTFFNVSRFDGPTRHRIWGNVGQSRLNWFSGHWGGGSQRFFHNKWLQKRGAQPPKNQYRWQLSTDRWNQTRSLLAGYPEQQSAPARNGGWRGLQNGAAIGTDGHARGREASDWACAEAILFDTILSNDEVRKVERYLEIKYGFEHDSSTPADGWTDSPVKMEASRNKCMDVGGASKKNGAKVYSWSCHNGPNQSWSYKPETQQLRDKNSGRCLDLPFGHVRNGNQLQVYTCDAKNKNQKWEVIDENRLRKPGTNKCVEISNASTKNGAHVQLWDCHDGAAQRWALSSK